MDFEGWNRRPVQNADGTWSVYVTMGGSGDFNDEDVMMESVDDERVSSLILSDQRFPCWGRLTDVKGGDGSLRNLCLPVRFKRARWDPRLDARLIARLEGVTRPGKMRRLQGGGRLAVVEHFPLDVETEALFMRWMMNDER
jgi:hypothetical protein